MRLLILSLFTIAAGAVVATALPAFAQESPTITDQHISRIKTNCQSALATLNQIHASDTPLYINRNQAYFSISDKLIARLNSRLALNRYDTTVLVQIANDYNTELTKFRAVYKQYDTAMADLVKRNCSKQPVGFYEEVAEVRERRGEVYTAIARLHELIDQYRSAVDTFESENETQLRADKND